jgi:hypothetical protein
MLIGFNLVPVPSFRMTILFSITWIDLSLVNTSIGPHCTWYVDQKSTHGSDNFVVNIKIS